MARLIPWRQPVSMAEDPVSVVLMLRQPIFHTKTRLRFAAEKAFPHSFGDASKAYVMKKGDKAIVHAQRHMISVLNCPKPYFKLEPEEYAAHLPETSQREAWAEHRAWTALDYLQGRKDIELEYCVLVRLAAEMLDSNCVGVYVPGERSFVPNQGSLYEDLRTLASSRISE